jgi:hypothetical protein
MVVAHPTSGGGEDGLIMLQFIPIQLGDQLLLIPTGSLAPNDLVFPLYWGFEEFSPGCLDGKDVLPWRLVEELPGDWRYRLV